MERQINCVASACVSQIVAECGKHTTVNAVAVQCDQQYFAMPPLSEKNIPAGNRYETCIHALHFAQSL